MKTKLLLIFILFIITLSCKQERKTISGEVEIYKNMHTGELIDDEQKFQDYINKLQKNYSDSTDGKAWLTLNMHILEKKNDTVFHPFSYDVKVNNEYIVRYNTSKKIGMELTPKTLTTIDGKTIQIGGQQDKPTLVNLWFIGCKGCEAEIPALNRLQEKYANEVNFVSMTFDAEKRTKTFLKRKKFNFIHIADAAEYIEYIGSKPYPENIFIDSNGVIRAVEGGLPIVDNPEDMEKSLEYFESILNKLLTKEEE